MNWDKVIPVTESGCWIWTGACSPNGYGHALIRGGGKKKYRDVHRTSYLLYKGHIPHGMTLDHLCRVKCCVNPDHLEVVTQKENNRRQKAVITHCPQGHPYNEENTYRRKDGKEKRDCKTCRSRRSKAVWLKLKMARVKTNM